MFRRTKAIAPAELRLTTVATLSGRGNAGNTTSKDVNTDYLQNPIMQAVLRGQQSSVSKACSREWDKKRQRGSLSNPR